MTTVAEAFVTLRPDVGKFKEETESGLGNMGGIAKTAALGIAAAGTALAGIALVSIKAAMDEEAGIQRLSQAIESNGGSWDALGGNIEGQISKWEKLTAFSDGEMRDALSTLTNMTGDAGTAMERLPIAMDFARGAGIDLGSASKLLGKVTDETTSVLAKYGIRVDKNADSTELLRLVQEKFAGQSEGYAKTAQGAWTIFHNQLDNLKEDVGTALLPVFTSFVTFATNGIDKLRADVLPAFIAKFAELRTAAKPVLDYLGGIWSSVIAPAITKVVQIVPQIAGAFGEMFDVLTGRRTDAGGVLAGLVGPDAAAGVMGTLGTVREAFTTAFDFAKPIIQGVIEKLTALKEKFDELPPVIKTAFAGLAVGELTGANDAIVGMGASIATMVSGALAFGTAAPGMIGGIGKMIGLLPTWIGLQGLAAAGLWATVAPFIPLIALVAALGLIVFLLITHWQELGDTLGMIGAIIGDFVGNAIGGLVKAVQDFFAPFGKWMELFSKDAPFALGILLTLIATLPFKVAAFISEMILKVAALIGEFKTMLFNRFVEIVGNVLGALGGMAEKGLLAVGDFIDDIFDAVGDLIELGPKLFTIATDAIGGFISGVFNAIPRLVAAAMNFAQRFLDGVKEALGIHSPSKVFAGVGMDVARGLAQGLESGQSLVDDAALQLATPGDLVAAGRGAAGAGAAVVDRPIVLQLDGRVIAEVVGERIQQRSFLLGGALG